MPPILDDGDDPLLPQYSDYKSINRHYTEAFSMRSAVHGNILKACEGKGASDAISAIQNEIDSHKQDSLCLSIKNYAKSSGLSRTIHESADKSQPTYF